jgi:alpha-D-ribose 1-methylphosphonate 5-triphosphate synthase subunit PhnH
MNAIPDLPGFPDPVPDSQAAFRAILWAQSHPGAIVTPAPALIVPAPLPVAAGALLLTLADADTTLWLAPGFAPARDWLRFHTGAPEARLSRADFVLAEQLPALETLGTGSDDSPHDGASLILPVAALGEGTRCHLSGPGIDGTGDFAATLPPGFAAFWAANHALFPRGVDVFLCAGSRLAALPRSVTLEVL